MARSTPAKTGLTLGVGELLWDLMPQGKVAGGAPFNFAFHATQAGLQGVPVSRVGDDDLGKELIELIKDRKLDASLIQTDPVIATGTVGVALEAGIPRYTIHEPAAWDRLEWNTQLEEAAESATALCFGTLAQRSGVSRGTITKLIKAASYAGALIVADLNLRQHFYTKEIIHESIAMSRWVKLSAEDWLGISQALNAPTDQPHGSLTKLRREKNLELIAYTDGEKGAWLCTETGDWHIPPVPVQVADTIGAGDAFTAGLVAAWHSGANWQHAGGYAAALAAEVVARSGGTPEIESDILDRLRKKFLQGK